MMARGALMVMAGWTAATLGAAHAAETAWAASWIWAERPPGLAYNDTIEARKTVELPAFSSATLRITADTRYRLYVNGAWVNDGPSRAWPEHYQYDVIELAQYLQAGTNELRVIAKHFGIGTFHQVPREPGLLAQLDVETRDGKTISIGTDTAWEVRDAAGWLRAAPKQSVQMGIFEIYDARLADSDTFRPAVVRHAAGEGPWRNLEPRDCPLLTRKPFPPREFRGASVVKRPEWQTFIFPTAALQYPDVTYANNHASVSGAYATMLHLERAGSVTIDADGNAVTVNGKRAKGNTFALEAGAHFVFVGLSEYFGHWRHDTEIRLRADAPYKLKNVTDGGEDGPWTYAPFEGAGFRTGDLAWSLMGADEQKAVRERLQGLVSEHVRACVDAASFRERLGGAARAIPLDGGTEAVHFLFKHRAPVEGAAAVVDNAEALVAGGTGHAVVEPSPAGDVELVLDLTEQNVGYWDFAIEAEAGLIVDVAAVEYIAPDGRVQHTDRYRNAMRYVCTAGRNEFLSLSRRSGRYLFVTLRNQTQPVTIHRFQVIESTYPVQPAGSFACSDVTLTRAWEISARTLKLCMEDVFTDCPLYEQTLWVGDARNESIFAYTAFGAEDLAKRCIRLTAQSLEQYPMALCQVPTTWEIILPAWSFLWGISVWDYFEHTGDAEFVREMYPHVIKNLRGAYAFRDTRGLFSAPFWNMFDWSGIDDGHRTVLHNSMFAAGAIDAALRCAGVIGDTSENDWLRAWRAELAGALDALWDPTKSAYPDSVRDDGSISPKTSAHTSFLALLYDLAPAERREALLRNALDPPEGMTRVGSPFAIMYLFEALERYGQPDRIVEAIRTHYGPMLEAGATTVWESFPSGTTGYEGFPTRSHTHAWSSAPIHFLNRIVLGIQREAPGGGAYVISPRLNGLKWAMGASAAPDGRVSVEWRIVDGILRVQANAPEGTVLRFERNETHEGMEVEFNKARVPG